MPQGDPTGKRGQGGVTKEVIPPEPQPDIKESPGHVSSTDTENATFIKCTINNVEICTLVDSGAAVTIMHNDTFQKIRSTENKLQRGGRPILGANNKPLDICGTTTLEINLGGKSYEHVVYVCNDLAQQLLLGADFLKANECVIDFTTNALVIKGRTIFMTRRCSSFGCHVRIAKSTVIPARSMMNVLCKVENGSIWNQHSGVLEPKEEFERRYSIGIIKVAATINNGMIPIRVFNPSDKPRRVYRASNVGKFCSLDDAGDRKLSPNDDEDQTYSVCHTLIKEGKASEQKEECHERFKIDNPNISSDEKKEVYEILNAHQKLFAFSKQDLGEIRSVEHHIDTGDARPIRVPPRRIPHHQRQTVREEVQAMLEADIIEPSNSPWCAPIVLVKKKDGTMRFCIDYRRLNQETKRDVFPLPRCDDILEAMAGAAFFTHLDLVRGYWQVGVAEESKEKTAFSTPEGHFQFKRMPFGLTNAPATFQRAMNSILNGLNWQDCLVYLDDVIVFASSLPEHNRRLESVLQRLEGAGVKLNASKCHFLQERATILGHVVSRDGVSTDPEKIKAIMEFAVPRDVSTLRAFLGCAGYYRHFVPNFADIAAPLYNLERKETSFQWTKECQDSFDALKYHLTSSPCLAYPRFDLPFIVDTDASDTGVGAVLSQVQNGEERVIAYAAKSLTKAQRNYSTTRKELYALVWGLEYFEVYLLGKQFHVRTDHSALKWLYSFKNPKGQVARWLERLAEFNFSIEHRPGRCHQNADALSRSPTPDTLDEKAVFVEAVTSGAWLGRWTKSEFALYQREDVAIGQVIKWVEKGERPERREIAGESAFLGSLWSQFNRLTMEDGLLFRTYESEDGKTKHLQLVVPQKLVKDVMVMLHDTPTCGHLGARKTAERVMARLYWRGWRQDVEDYCRSCRVCSERNAPAKMPRAKMGTMPCGYPMERVAMDVVGPLPKTIHGNRFILVVSDYFTRWPEAYAIASHDAETVAQKLVEEWISRYGVMQHLHTDQGREFESKLIQDLAQLLGVNKTRTTPYHPQSDGLVERCNRTLKDMLSKVVDENQNDWDTWIPHVLLAYPTAVHASTGVTPHRLMFGREARIPVDLLVERKENEDVSSSGTTSYATSSKEKFHEAHELARSKTRQATRRYKDYYDSKSSGTPYKVGDKVWLFNPSMRSNLSKKLGRPWQGPYTVVKALSDTVFRIQREGRGRKRVVVHFNRLKPCIVRRPDLVSSLPEDNPKYDQGKDSTRNGSARSNIQEPARSSIEYDSDDEDIELVVRRRGRPENQESGLTAPSVEDPITLETEQESPAVPICRNSTSRNRRPPAWLNDYHR